MSSLAALKEVASYLTPLELSELDGILRESLPIWVPLPGPQTAAYESEADILYYGGAAGGGKTDLLIGIALTSHTKSIIYRREGVQTISIEDRVFEILGSKKGWNGQDSVLRLNGRQIELGSCKDLGDEQKYQGRAHDFKGFDEIPHFQESQFRFLCGWLRSSKKGQRKRIIAAGNPPTNKDGQWVTSFWAPWLDPTYPNPAQPGELRWFTTVAGKDFECPNGDPIEIDGEMVQPLSRTFIPSKVQDNAFMMESGYEAILQALPEPLRSQMLRGDFSAGTEDSMWQVIPTEWVELAMSRWSEDGKKGDMTSCGVDVARGGKDSTVISTRYGSWYSRLRKLPGIATPDGQTAAGAAISEIRDGAPIHVDVIGVGGSVVDHLKDNDIQVIGINGAESAGNEYDKATRQLKFRNKRALLYWRFREALDPRTGANVALPPDSKLKADLCAPQWKLTTSGIQIEAKEDIIKRIGRSPDDGDAVVYCWVDTIKRATIRAWEDHQKDNDFNPLTYGLGGN